MTTLDHQQPPGVWDYALRVRVTITGETAPVEIDFPDWDAIADWIASPGRWTHGPVESITITLAGERP